MSKEIDWSKAPEGATHYLPAKDENCHDLWLKMDEGYVIQVGYTEPGCTDWVFYYTKEKQPTLDTSMAIPCKPRWTGTGLPPVGTVCEFCGGYPDPVDPWHAGLKDGAEVSIIAHYNNYGVEVAVFTFDDCRDCVSGFQVDQAVVGCFRPIRTQAQIEAEERDKAIDEICYDICFHFGNPKASEKYLNLATTLYDAGYRKTEAGK